MVTPSALFVFLTGIIFLLIAIVVLMERVVLRKKEATLQDPVYEYTKEMKELKKSNIETQQLLYRIDLLARKALSQSTPGEHVDYSQLAETYKEKPHIVQFCEAMTESLYAGERITPQQTKNLVHTLEDMLKGEGKLVLIEEKSDKIETKQGFFLDKIIEKLAMGVGKKITDAKVAEEQKKAIEEKQKMQEEQEIKSEKAMDFKKEHIVLPEKSKKKQNDKKEYHYIESIDVLDRIEKKLNSKKALKN